VRGVTAQVYENGRRLALGASATSAHWIGDTALFALGDGSVRTAAREGDTAHAPLHDGAILAACVYPDGKRLLTAGDDGALRATVEGGDSETLLQTRGKWIDHLVASPVSGVIVAGVGKEAIVLREGREAHRFTYPSTIGGLALDAKGRRLAASHYNGITLRYALMADDKGQTLNWSGSHLAVTLSPDAEYVISAMQENALHGWRLQDKIDLRMDGYPSKTRSFSWDKRGRWLATSGADRAVLWHFVGKLGPQGKQPMLLGQREALVTAVAFHPSEDVVAIGYSDGVCVLARLADEAVMDMDEAGEGAVTALAWNAVGNLLAVGDEAGRGAIVKI
jgi:WD40 repeat protein